MNTTLINRGNLADVYTQCLEETWLPLAKKTAGKVRDRYELDDQIILVTTDRLSAFDRNLALIPHKGQVLNQISAWWFEKTAKWIPNHFLALPDPNVMLVRKCDVFPIEFVVRGYITGTTSTSLWTQYAKGTREYCGLSLAEGLQKNQRLDTPLLTPTTKEKHHDRPISPAEIISEGWMTEADWQEASALALKLYRFGVDEAKKQDLILVDTKYEFGRDAEGRIRVVDELHTPDSSRYWLAKSYDERIAQGLEPENIDKEFLRLWFAEHCDPYNDQPLPEAPPELVEELSKRYRLLYEMITARPFVPAPQELPVTERILRNLSTYLK